ncbi:TPA: hypothetical protein OW432_000846 [Pseudomonas aeruginosa]|uniref:hypothetical protein n=1 Tax=Pseudomonas TaxID=286 RepID=UPI002293DD7E|nr:hypothetical protein [Pseudomonas aeruginosa]HCE9911910.1 hypothetical protein [Pseudomonas aeruginosa]HCW0466587.1 hypothetical protein [Pseudomonas aeruginosa]HCW0936799.1 hypothetical protein [Pseudomonas aeruginosa]
MKTALPNGRNHSSSLRMRQTKSELEIAIAGGDHALLTIDAIRAEATTLKVLEHSMMRAFGDGGDGGLYSLFQFRMTSLKTFLALAVAAALMIDTPV